MNLGYPMNEEQVTSIEETQSDQRTQFLQKEESVLESGDSFRNDAMLTDMLEERSVDESPRARTSSVPSGSLLQIPIYVRVILGTAKMALSKVMALGPGSVIALDQKLSEPVLLMINGKEFAKGAVVVVDEKSGQLGISITELFADPAPAELVG
jgi:flagellar motor switch protein FliN